MKKIFTLSLFAALLSILAAQVFAEEFDSDMLARPHRYFEIGVDSDTAVANNLVGIKDIFKKNIEIDLQQISKDMSGSGFKLGLYNQEKVFMNLNISSRFRFSLFAGVETSAHMNISDDLFKLLGSGLSVGETKTVDVTGYADVFANMGVSFQTLVSNYGIRITPTFFVPLIYVPKTKATGTIRTESSGLIRAEAEANVDIYTVVNMHDFMEDSYTLKNLGLNQQPMDILSKDILPNGGFDLTLEIDRNWFHNFNAGLYTRIPIVGGKLNYKMSTRVWAYFYETNALGYLNDTEDHDYDYGQDDFTYSEDSYKAYRPFKLGLNASYAPFGQWMKIQPSLGIAVRNPYSSDMIIYPEYSLDFRFAFLLRIFNFNLGTAYQNQIFQQRFGLSLNFRAIEILAQVSMCGTGFISSFDRNGYGAMVGFRMGF